MSDIELPFALRALDMYDPRTAMPDVSAVDVISYSAALSRYLAQHLASFTDRTADDVLVEARKATTSAEQMLGSNDPRSATLAIDYLNGTVSDNVDLTRLMWSFRDLNGLILGLVAQIDSFDDFGVLLDTLRQGLKQSMN